MVTGTVPRIVVDDHDVQDPVLDARGSLRASSSAASAYSVATSYLNDPEIQQLHAAVGRDEKTRRWSFSRHDDDLTPLYGDNLNNQRYYEYVNKTLLDKYYSNSTREDFSLPWNDILETLLFGDLLGSIFANDTAQLFSYLLHGHLEAGDVVFDSPIDASHIYRLSDSDIEQVLRALLANIVVFNEVLELYLSSNSNLHSDKLFELFKNSTSLSGPVLQIPLAQAMFGNWLLSFNRDSAAASNYDNALILNYFRKLARLATVLRKLHQNGFFDQALKAFSGKDTVLLSHYLDKDNNFALSISLNNLAEFYQVHNEYHISTNMWELNCHITKDKESGDLAILGLTNEFGYGNKYRTLNKLGKKNKTSKFNSKRRVAQLYRILIKAGSNDDVGTSWVWKEKYD